MYKADFYVFQGVNLEWLGSVLKNGCPWNIPLEILIQVNKIMYEELLLEHLKKVGGSIKDNHDRWPHSWDDSKMTDYSYIFNPRYSKVFMYQPGSEFLLDPIKIVQGNSLLDSYTLIEAPNFPKMKLKVRI